MSIKSPFACRSLLAALFLSAVPVLLGQNGSANPSPTPSSLASFWRAELPTGTYAVRLSSITSVSMHEYYVGTTIKVTEVDIGTQGSELARFYYVEAALPAAPNNVGEGTKGIIEDKVKQVVERAAPGIDTKVVKDYPTSTHAHTVEYRLADLATLKKLFESAQKALLEDRGESFKP